MSVWAVECQVQRTDYTHTWRGQASSSSDATDAALKAARLAWPGFSFAVRAVTQVAA